MKMNNITLIGMPGAGKSTPVSYTHLDVYKRQHQSSWDFLKTMFPFLPSPLWYRRKWQTECRLVLEQRITEMCIRDSSEGYRRTE